MHALGLCTGASTITLVDAEKNGRAIEINAIHSYAHEGNPKQVVKDLLRKFDLKKVNSIVVTGRGFKEFLNLTNISEPLAVECALKHINNDGKHYNAIISAGGETFIVYKLDDSGKIGKVFTGNKCASGTGEFFLQQIRRMDVSLEEAIKYAQNEEPHHVSGRCSVFCKSDCTHATNKGVPKGKVVAGLCRMMANKVLELLKNIPKENILIVGGATKNKVMIDYLSQEITNLAIPKEAAYFEALGAALWAMENKTKPIDDLSKLFTKHTTQFDYHQPLRDFENKVTFTQMKRGTVRDGDKCILGLDVGSTTTKLVLLRESDLKILASEYLRTNGDPVRASRECYKTVLDQLNGTKVIIRGLGVTGSGRKIAGLHALTDGVINEIIAHATAALYFDSEVDTIFEIGGQDAKYTYITNGVASDYAMNEACSAGTGSFLEESAKETLGIEMEDIADWAMKGNRPPNFNDQCAAFISSDIKNTFHEGIPKEDVVAGLVYSICMNYVNRVKGARPVGKKVFMQGGVCYNRAVPIAMAALSGKEIVVPPEPGLMGSYGVALEVKHRVDRELIKEQLFNLETLANREVRYKKPFICPGGKEKCDLKCEINRIDIEGKTYPFGGACNRYYSVRHKIKMDIGRHDLITLRQKLVFNEFAPDLSDLPEDAPTVGILRSFLTNTYYPLFAHFFKELGFRPVLSKEIDPEGINQCAAPFCFPCEISHGYFKNLLDLKPDYIFLPHIHGVEVENGYYLSKMCPLLQGEPYFLKSTFEERLINGPILLLPFIDLVSSIEKQKKYFMSMVYDLGVSKKNVATAFEKAVMVQNKMQEYMIEIGTNAIREIESDPDRIGVILFGRSYNAFVPEANKGIPNKFASRGITIIPVDFFNIKSYPVKEHMFWSMGQIILKAAEGIKNHPQLYGTFITNFACGPDSFIIGYFRDIMGRKPSLTLELDNHTADAGLETRVEAFLDIVTRYRQLKKSKKVTKVTKDSAGDSYGETEKKFKEFRQATTMFKNNKFLITTSEGEEISLFDPRVRVVFASMGQFATAAMAAVMKKLGIKAVVLPAADEEDLKLGRGNTLCKECLPLQLTVGALLKYIHDKRSENEVTVYFMPTSGGPCRFGQYQVFMRDFVKKHKIKNVAFMSLSVDSSYEDFGMEFKLLGWHAGVIADIFEDVYNAMLVVAEDRDRALSDLQAIWSNVLNGFEHGRSGIKEALDQAAKDLKRIPRKKSLKDVPQALIVGEIYVRNEGLSRRWLPERLAESGIVSHVAPIHEWLYYTEWLAKHKLMNKPVKLKNRLINKVKNRVMVHIEKNIKEAIAESGWYIPRIVDVDHVIKVGENFISRKLIGEAILTVGGPLAEVGEEFCGAIAIGPFGCMPNRLSESILNLKMDREHIMRLRKDAMTDNVTREIPNMPFLAIESDGSPFPQLIEARLETFIVQALRLHDVMMKYRNENEN
ncbi:MAG: activase [Candidatus Marinimicrobia bacterium]|nr:activase [Candidatus Neomarinimicrobiota bacterium]